jgi:uncharacterized LabA/DUF88 family protein
MLRGMVFVDYLNFEISMQTYYKSLGLQTPRLDYNILFSNVVKLIPDIDYLKTFIFYPKPDEFLIQDKTLLNNYKWITGVSSAKYIDVIEGRYIARPVTGDVSTMDISNRNTYYKTEKGTDINLAIHALSKAHFNSYDVAFVMSGDTDYISVYKQLKNIGKIVTVVAIKGQNLKSLITEIDDYKFLDKDFFDTCLRQS